MNAVGGYAPPPVEEPLSAGDQRIFEFMDWIGRQPTRRRGESGIRYVLNRGGEGGEGVKILKSDARRGKQSFTPCS